MMEHSKKYSNVADCDLIFYIELILSDISFKQNSTLCRKLCLSKSKAEISEDIMGGQCLVASLGNLRRHHK